MKRIALNASALAVLAAGSAYLATPAYAMMTVKCTTTIVRADGTKITIVVEGDTCQVDFATGACSCT